MKAKFEQKFQENDASFDFSSYFKQVNQQLLLYMTKTYFSDQVLNEQEFEQSLIGFHFFESSALLAISASICDLVSGNLVYYQPSFDLVQLYEDVYEIQSIQRKLLDSKMYLEVILKNSPQMIIVKIPETLDDIFQAKFFCPVKILEWDSQLDFRQLCEVYLYRKRVLPQFSISSPGNGNHSRFSC